MKIVKSMMWVLTTLVLVSCVTINIYFPAAAAEKAADRIIEDVWGPAATQDEQPASEKDTMPTSRREQTNSIAISVLNWMIPVAQATEPNININSPAISAIQTRMKQRHESLLPYYQSGAVGLTASGLVSVRDASVISLKDRNSVKGLVANENGDREALYAEIARANGHPEWKADIQQTFARRWVSNASTGWWYEQSGSWMQK